MIDRGLTKLNRSIQKRFGRKKPYALGMDEWNEFYKKYKEEEPVRYFLCETVPEKILWGYRKAIGWKIRRVNEYFYYRFIDKYHVVTTDLTPQYYDKDTVLFHANFSILTEFVESELGWLNLIVRDKNDGSVLSEKYKRDWFIMNRLDWFGILKRRFRSRELGIDYLQSFIDNNPYDTETEESHAKSLMDQKASYGEILALYLWYTEVRANRDDPHVPSMAEMRPEFEEKYGMLFLLSDKFKKENPETYKEYKDIIDKKHEAEKDHDREDTEMLIRLVKIRDRLWT